MKINRPEKDDTSSKPQLLKQKRYIKIKRFVQEYLVDLNATKAFQRCGWGKGNTQSDNVEAVRLLKRPDVQQLIAEAEMERAKSVSITQEMVLSELSLLAFANLKDLSTWDGNNFVLKPFDQLTREQVAVLSEIRVTQSLGSVSLQFKTYDKKSALIDLGRHLGMFWEGNRQDDPVEFAQKSYEALQQIEERTGGTG